jgi:hypothetical protein
MDINELTKALADADLDRFRVLLESVEDIDTPYGEAEWPLSPKSILETVLLSSELYQLPDETQLQFANVIISKSNNLTGNDSLGGRLLIKLAKDGKYPSVQALIDAGVDPNFSTSDTHPLLEAIRSDNSRVLICLFELGSDAKVAEQVLKDNDFEWNTLRKWAKYKKSKQCDILLQAKGLK